VAGAGAALCGEGQEGGRGGQQQQLGQARLWPEV
jgi:hypothetical protein